MKITRTRHFENRERWRAWLEKHHKSAGEIWLVWYRKRAGRRQIPYDDAVEEALCFGWIDSIVQKLDEQRFARKFTTRSNARRWSAINIERARRMIREGRMTQAGRARFDPAPMERPASGGSTASRVVLPATLKKELMANRRAWRNFSALAPSYRRNYIRWIVAAKREATRERRLAEAISLLERNAKLPMK